MDEGTPRRNHDDESAFLTLHEFVKVARAKLSANVWDYLTGATET